MSRIVVETMPLPVTMLSTQKKRLHCKMFGAKVVVEIGDWFKTPLCRGPELLLSMDAARIGRSAIAEQEKGEHGASENATLRCHATWSAMRAATGASRRGPAGRELDCQARFNGWESRRRMTGVVPPSTKRDQRRRSHERGSRRPQVERAEWGRVRLEGARTLPWDRTAWSGHRRGHVSDCGAAFSYLNQPMQHPTRTRRVRKNQEPQGIRASTREGVHSVVCVACSTVIKGSVLLKNSAMPACTSSSTEPPQPRCAIHPTTQKEQK